MLADGQSILESAIHITSERDKSELPSVLVSVVSKVLEHEAVFFLKLSDTSEVPCYLDIVSSITQSASVDCYGHTFRSGKIDIDDFIADCLKKRAKRTSVRNGKVRSLFPIVVDDKVYGVLEVLSPRMDAESEKLIDGFLQVYTNYLAIMVDSERDALTGLLNRRTFDYHFADLMEKSRNSNKMTMIQERRHGAFQCWLGVLDIDHFKSVNDKFGHLYGDEVLLLFSDLMRKTIRHNDLMFRFGGEEFVVVLASNSEEDAFTAFERFRQNLAQYEFPRVGKVTVSIGMVGVESQELSATLLEHADRALYFAKEHGRNQVCEYDDLVKRGLLSKRESKSDFELF